MDTKKAIALMQLNSGATIVTASYISGIVFEMPEAMQPMNSSQRRITAPAPTKNYAFKNVLGINLMIGDLAVVQSNDSYALVKIEEINVMPTKIGCNFSALKHVVTRVDLGALQDVLATEANAEYRLSMSEITSQLDTFRKQVGETSYGALENLLGKKEIPVPTPPDMPEGFPAKHAGWDNGKYPTAKDKENFHPAECNHSANKEL